MFSLQRCRELLDGDPRLPDAALEILRDQLYALAEIATTELVELSRKSCVDGPAQSGTQFAAGSAASPFIGTGEFQRFVRSLSKEEREELEERAAVLEFDAGITRNQAEQVVILERSRNHDSGGRSHA